MADEYPRLLEDRDVVVIGTATSNRPGCADGWMGMTARCRPTGSSWSPAWGATPARIPLRDRTCSRALVRLRRQLEPNGLMVAVQGSRRDTYPSGMARDMGGGLQVYIMRPDCAARLPQRPFLVTAENQRGQLPVPGVGHHPD